jgi:hypothetical protein
LSRHICLGEDPLRSPEALVLHSLIPPSSVRRRLLRFLAGLDKSNKSSYQCLITESNAYDIETVRQIEILAKSLGGLAECKRLGFIYQNDDGVMSLSSAGLGYLLYVNARGITSLAEAFAAGRECALVEIDG